MREGLACDPPAHPTAKRDSRSLARHSSPSSFLVRRFSKQLAVLARPGSTSELLCLRSARTFSQASPAGFGWETSIRQEFLAVEIDLGCLNSKTILLLSLRKKCKDYVCYRQCTITLNQHRQSWVCGWTPFDSLKVYISSRFKEGVGDLIFPQASTLEAEVYSLRKTLSPMLQHLIIL